MRVIDERYLAHIRDQPCVACQRHPSDPDHIQARQWRESNRNDHFVLPLCRACHTEREQVGNQRFEAKWHMNLWHEVARFMSDYYAKSVPSLRLIPGKLG